MMTISALSSRRRIRGAARDAPDDDCFHDFSFPNSPSDSSRAFPGGLSADFRLISDFFSRLPATLTAESDARGNARVSPL